MKSIFSLLIGLLLLVGGSLPVLAQAPTISGFSPTSGPAGTLVTITGTNLNTVRGVRFGGGGLALFTAQTAGSLSVRVPVDAASGALRLTPASGNAVSTASSFTVGVPTWGLAATLSPAGPLDACQARTLTASAALPGFTTGTGANSGVLTLVVQADGKVLAGGNFTSYRSATANRLVRVNPDGGYDATFVSGSGFNNTVNSIAVQADGKVLVGGEFTSYNGSAAPNLIRLNANGSIDGTFAIGGGFDYTQSRPHHVQSVVVQPDGQILVAGLFDLYNGQAQGNVVRLNPNGSRDASFTGQMTSIRGVNTIALQDDGKVLIGGAYIENQGDVQAPIYRSRIVRFNPNGTDDATFNVGGTGFYVYFNGAISNGARVNSLAVQADGKIVAGGYFVSYNGASRSNLVRLLPTGQLDAGFVPPGGMTEIWTVAVLRSGRVLAGSTFDPPGANYALTGFNTNGTADLSFNIGTASQSNSYVYSVAEQPDGRILVGGYFDIVGGVGQQRYLARTNADGTLNNTATAVPAATFTFSPGTTTTNPLTTSVAGNYSAVASYNGETSPASNTVTLTTCVGAVLQDYPGDPGFSPTSGPAGTLVTIYGNRLLTVQSVRFGTGGVGLITGYEQFGNNITVQVPVDAATGPLTVTTSTGQVLTTINTFTYLPKPYGLTATVTPAGPLDFCAPRTLTATAATPAFTTGVGYNAPVNDVTLTLTNKVLVAGDFTLYNGTTGHQGIMQLNVDGTRDANFATSGAITLGVGGSVQSVVRYTDNTILVGGNFTTSTGPRNLMRLYADGWANPGRTYNSFNLANSTWGAGFNGLVRSIVVQADNRIVVGGDFTSYNGATTSGVARVNGDGSYDASFVVGSGANGPVYTVALQADGKVLIGGAFTTYNGAPANGIARLNPSGSRDATFTGTGVNAGGTTGVSSIGVQPDGKVLLGGTFTTYNGATRNRIVRLNADGTVDATFGTGTGFDGNVQRIVVQPDGKLVLGGSFTTYKGVAAARIIRLNADGSVDNSFVPGTGANAAVTTLALQPNGLVVAGGAFTTYNGTAANRIARLSTDGTQNTAPTPISGVAFDMSNANGTNPFYVRFAVDHYARATLNGITANSNTVTVTPCVAPTITSFTPTSGETGTAVTITGTSLGDVSAVRVNGTAALITSSSGPSLTFTVAAGTTTGAVTVTNPAGTVTGGTFTVLNPTVSGTAPATGPAGTLVTLTGTNLDRVRGVRFGTGGLGLFTAQSATSLTVRVPVDAATGVLTLTSMAGNTLSSAPFTYTPRPAGLVASLSPVGPQDACEPRTLTAAVVSPAFGPGTGFNNEVLALVVQADGRVLAGGSFTTYQGAAQNRLVRTLPDGARDASFSIGTGFSGSLGIVRSVAVQVDGKVLVGGSFTSYNGTSGLVNLIRLNADGSRDATFATGSGFNASVTSVVVQPDGKVLVGGYFTTYNGTAGLNRLVRLNANGSRDVSFTTGTGFDANVNSVVVQPDGKVLVGGRFAAYNGTAGLNRLVRLNADGSRDASFATGTGFDGDVYHLAMQPDGNVLAGGAFTAYNGTSGLNRLLRLTADGSRDATFSIGTGFDNTVRSLVIQPDGQVLAGGDFTACNGTAGLNRLVRLSANGALAATFGTGTGFDNAVWSLAIQPNGQVLAGGTFTTYNGSPANYLVRLTTTGALDTTPTPVAGATFTFSPGGSTTNPLVTTTPGSYSVVATLNGETSEASNPATLTACPAPTITSFTPPNGQTNTVVTVSGTNLSFASAARVNGTAGTIVGTPTATSLTFTVAAGTTTGPVTVTTLGGTATGGTFTVTPVTITSFTPTTGGTGTVVTLTGTNLLGATGVRINNVAVASFTVVSDTQITFTVASGNTTGPVTVTMPGGGVITGGTFTVDTVTITSFSPTSGGVGTVVVITGTNLTGATSVRINSLTMTGFVVNSDTQITFTVAPTATTGPVRVIKSGGISVLGGTFTVVPLSIAGFSPASGPAGTLVTITGISLDQVRGVRFGGSGLGLFTAQSPTSITVQVPTDATTGVLTLTSLTGAAPSTTDSFTYTPRPAGLVATLSPAGPLAACTPHTLTAAAVSPGFSPGTGLNDPANSVVTQPDGKMLVGGTFTTYNGTTANRLIRLNPDGTRDATFNTGTGFGAAVNTVAVQADGKVLVAGVFTTYNGAAAGGLIRLNPDGTRDATFTGTGFAGGSVLTMVVQPDGRILAGGTFSMYNGVGAAKLQRLNPDGTRDATFSASISSTVTSVALQADGKVMVGTSYSGFASPIIRLTAEGTRDFTFAASNSGLNSTVTSVAVQPDGKVVVGGYFTQYVGLVQKGIVRFSATGSPEYAFGIGYGNGFVNGGPAGYVSAITLQPDGKIVVVGNFTGYNGTPANRLIRLTAAGNPDATLATGSGFDNLPRWAAVQADGNLLVGGDFTTYNGTPANRVIRLTATGSAHTTATPVSDATFTFSPGNTTVNPLITSAGGSYSVVASFNGAVSEPSNPVTIAACPTPTISGFTPAGGPVGTLVTVTGTNLSAATAVRVDGAAGTITGAPTATSLTFTVGAGSTTGVIAITTPDGTATSTGSFTVSTNQAPTAVGLSPQSVTENTAGGTAIGTFSATDPDAGDTFTYSLVSGNGDTDNGAFSLNGSGQLVITAAPDYETQVSYAIRVRATDQDGLWLEQTFTISVTDVVEDLVISTAGQGIAPGTYGRITITGTGEGLLGGDIVVVNALVVQAGGLLDDLCHVITGAGSVTVQAGATLNICAAGGLNSAGTAFGPALVQTTGAHSYSDDAIYAFTAGFSAQITGDEFPATVRELRVRCFQLDLTNPALAIRRRLGVEDLFGARPAGLRGGPNGFLVSGSRTLTLLSSAAGTAYVVNAPGREVIGANVHVQRYIPGPPAASYHHLSSPVQNSTVADLATAGFAPKVNAAYNALPTPVLPAAAFPNVFGFDEARGGLTPAYQDFQTGYFSPAALSAPLIPGQGYSVAIGGGRTPDFVGILNNDNLNVALNHTGTNTAANKAGWHLLGNPYAQPIDWDLLATPANMDAAVYVWYGTGGSTGAYRVRNASGVGNLSDGVIGIGQAFFVRTTAATTFSFTNALRVEDAYATPLGRMTPDARPRLTLTLAAAGAPAAQTDEATVYAEQGATAGFDGPFDAVRPGRNVGVPTLSVLIDGREAMISALAAENLTDGTTVELALDLPAAGTYVLAVGVLTNLPNAVLLDRSTGTAYDLTTQPTVTFTAAGTVSGRFALVFGGRVLNTPTETSRPTFALYPNPAHHVVRLVGGAAESATLLDATGRTVRTWTLAPGTVDLSLAGVAPGVYSVRVGAASRRLVIE